MANTEPSWRDRVLAALVNTANPDLRVTADLLSPDVLTLNPSPTVPLSHYTTFSGLEGIVSSGRFWATEASYLNDATEREYARRIIEGHLQTQESLHPGTPVQDALRAARKTLDGAREHYAHFVLCFCEDHDLLSMWTSYAGRGGGFSLEFDGPRIARLALRPLGCFVKVAYGDELSDHPMVKAFERSCTRIAAAVSGPINSDVLGATLAISLENLFVRLKHPAFREEHEWRVLIRESVSPAVQSFSHVLFRGADFSVKPYIELSLPPEDPTSPEKPPMLPLRRVTVGPTLRPEETVRAVRWLLRKHGYDSVEVAPSEAPYRT